jgi:hypothetical protein
MTGKKILSAIIEYTGFIRGESCKIGQRINRPIYDWRRETAGVDVFQEDWDALILLDGCRADAFSDCHDLPGILESRISRGSSSMEFLEANTADKQLQDVVYVTANPHVYRLDSTTFYSLDRWDPTRQTVPPGVVTDAALERSATVVIQLLPG